MRLCRHVGPSVHKRTCIVAYLRTWPHAFGSVSSEQSNSILYAFSKAPMRTTLEEESISVRVVIRLSRCTGHSSRAAWRSAEALDVVARNTTDFECPLRMCSRRPWGDRERKHLIAHGLCFTLADTAAAGLSAAESRGPDSLEGIRLTIKLRAFDASPNKVQFCYCACSHDAAT